MGKHSKIPGVYWKEEKWVVSLSIYGIMTHYGYFEDRLQAESKAIEIRREIPKYQYFQHSFKKKGTSKYRGVTRDSIYWQAKVSCQKKCVYLGTFKNEKLAAIAHDAAAIKVYGKDALLNRNEHPEDFCGFSLSKAV